MMLIIESIVVSCIMNLIILNLVVVVVVVTLIYQRYWRSLGPIPVDGAALNQGTLMLVTWTLFLELLDSFQRLSLEEEDDPNTGIFIFSH